MIYILSGLAIAGAGGAGFWYFLPANGRVHPTVALPYFDFLIPITVVMAVMIGILMIIAGVTLG
jgi:hypothetical protein